MWFVPGWFYRSNPETGADFHRQRALFTRLGIAHRLVPLVENGTIETNAAIIADELRMLDPARDRVHAGQREQRRPGGRVRPSDSG